MLSDFPQSVRSAAVGATARSSRGSVNVSLHVDVPEGRRRQFRAVLRLHTAADPALGIEAARLWSEPTEVARLLGPRAETETLRRATAPCAHPR
ncbi:hypothetical protein ACQEV4_02430 [Streptomyces shenzhenensis]|uniref:hypothetical protein n=1 Tax=Streptomyces shenzhenensis TaxID=943815 RepID=UPI003D8AEE2B